MLTKLDNNKFYHFRVDGSYYIFKYKDNIYVFGEECQENKIRYPHDCKNCIYLYSDGKYDCYICPKSVDSENYNVVARYSSNPFHYYSGRNSSIPILKDIENFVEKNYIWEMIRGLHPKKDYKIFPRIKWI